MTSSTSSSKFFLKTSLLVTGLLAVYALVLPIIKVTPTVGQNQYQDNLIKAEGFLYASKKCDFVILGSSLAFRLEESYFSRPTCNLALGGDSALTGLSILKKSRAAEKTHLIVELSVLKSVDQKILNDLYGGPWFFLKSTSMLFLQESQPVTVLLSAMRKLYPPAPKITSLEQFKIWLDYQIQDSSVADIKHLQNYQNQLKILHDELEDFAKHGHKVTLLWMPLDSNVLAGKKYQEQLKLAQTVFNPDQWMWLLPPSHNFETTDGIHLTESAARQWANFIDVSVK